MSKGKKSKDKLNLVGYDPVESPEEIISSDKNIDRREAFRETYKRVMMIVPEYFIKKKKKKAGSTSSGGNSFTQNIVITPENVKLETKENEVSVEREEEREK